MDAITPPDLNLADRCDNCSAQAFVRAIMPGGGDLLFCAHHFAKKNEVTGKTNEEVLRSQALHIQDETHKINKKPSMSANAL